MKRLEIFGIAVAAATLFASSALADENKQPDEYEFDVSYSADDESEGESNDAAAEEATPTTSRVTFVYFGRGAHSIVDSDKQELVRLKNWAAQDRARWLVVAPHSNMIGTDEYTSDLCGARGSAIRHELMQGDNGIGMARIRVMKFQEEIPSSIVDDQSVHVVVYMVPDAVAGAGDAVTEPEHEPVQTPPPPKPRQTQNVYVTVPADTADDDDELDHLATSFGIGVSLGGGVTGFVDREMRDFSDTGGAWEARLTLGTRRLFAAEFAYIGSANSIDTLGLDTNALLVGNGVEGNVRFNLLDVAVQPYLFGGLGWTHYSLERSDVNTSNVQDNEDVMFVPLGAGIGFRAFGGMIDLRGTYRAAFYDDIIRGTETEDLADEPVVGLENWTASAKVGWEF